MKETNEKDRELSVVFWRYLWSSILISLSASVGTVVDGIIVGNLIGEDGLSAVNLSSPMIQLLFTISLVVASGAGMLIGFALGQKDGRRVRYIFTLSMVASLLVGVLFTGAGFYFSDSITRAFCHDDYLFTYTHDYLKVILIGAPSFMMLWEISAVIGVDGSPRLASLAIIVDNLVNLCLDIVFIEYVGWGIAGSAAATVVGHLVGILIMLRHFKGKGNSLTFSLTHDKPEFLNIVLQGAPLAIASVCLTLLLVSANHVFLSAKGQNGIFVFAVCMNLLQIYNMYISGTCRTLQSLGAVQIGKNDDHAFSLILRKSFLFITVSMAVTCLLICLFPGVISRAFGADSPEVIAECNHVFRIFAVSFIPFCYIYLIMIVYKLYKQDCMALFISFALSLTVIPVLLLFFHYAPQYLWYSYLVAYLLEIVAIFVLHKLTHARLNL